MERNRICALFKIQYPIIQAGMIWCSGWELAAAVSNAGGLGIIGSGSMYPEILEEQIQKCQAATSLPFAVNLPMLYPSIEEHIQTIIKYKVPIVFTSAGNPNTYTSLLKSHGITVVHVVSSVKFALKAEQAGVDAIVAEGFEAGGHNGRDETTTLCLIPMVASKIKIPLIAAGGIANGSSMLAALHLGADALRRHGAQRARPAAATDRQHRQLLDGHRKGPRLAHACLLLRGFALHRRGSAA